MDGSPHSDKWGEEDRPGADDDAKNKDLIERLGDVIGRFETEAKRRVDRRVSIEQKWIEDLQQYHGQYDADTQEKLDKLEGSQVFVNLTATKTDAMEARLWDLLFPTDDRSWGISPTPVPELSRDTEQSEERIDQLEKEGAEAKLVAETSQDPAAASQAADLANAANAELAEVQAKADELHEILNEAKARADLMQEEIHDQLVQCNYQAEARDLIGWACKIGFGVIKGPVTGQKVVQKWKQAKTTDQMGNEVTAYELSTAFDDTPAAYAVDPFSFFPDPDVVKMTDSEGFYERHLLNKQQMRRLARRPDIDKASIKEILSAPPKTAPSYMTQLVAIDTGTDGQVKDLYQVWEYTGPVDSEDLRALAESFEDEGLLEEIAEDDTLIEMNAKVWFCDGRALSFALHPLDSGDPIYSTFTIRPSTSSPFGDGIPRIMRDPQRILSAAWRMMMDNSALSTGPQILVDKMQVKPQDGNWTITARKIWNWIGGENTNRPPFSTFNIESNQQELANIINLAREMIDEVTAMPAIAEGQQGTNVTKTAQGMALLMNSANVSFRRIVKMFDDDVSTPLIRRFYDFNMQFSQKEEIKGDYEVQARGSSVLLVREMQAQNLLMIALQFGDHPEYGPRLKKGDLMKQIFRAHMISADELLKTEREFERDQAEQGGSPEAAAMEQANALKEQELALKREEMDQKTALAELEWGKRLEIAQLNYDTAMERVAAQMNMSREELDAKIGQNSRVEDGKERRLAAEVAMAERTGKSAGGSV